MTKNRLIISFARPCKKPLIIKKIRMMRVSQSDQASTLIVFQKLSKKLPMVSLIDKANFTIVS
jgi:hypothetical protein